MKTYNYYYGNEKILSTDGLIAFPQSYYDFIHSHSKEELNDGFMREVEQDGKIIREEKYHSGVWF